MQRPDKSPGEKSKPRDENVVFKKAEDVNWVAGAGLAPQFGRVVGKSQGVKERLQTIVDVAASVDDCTWIFASEKSDVDLTYETMETGD